MEKSDDSHNEPSKRPSARRTAAEDEARASRDAHDITDARSARDVRDLLDVTDASAAETAPGLEHESGDADRGDDAAAAVTGSDGDPAATQAAATSVKRVRARRPGRRRDERSEPRQTQHAGHAQDGVDGVSARQPLLGLDDPAHARPAAHGHGDGDGDGATASRSARSARAVPAPVAHTRSEPQAATSEHDVWRAGAEDAPGAGHGPGPGLARARAAQLAVGTDRGDHGLQREELDGMDSAELGDDFGLDAEYEAQLRPWLERFCKHYVRVEVRGAHSVPAQGRALLVANHSRALTWDGIILRTALRMHHETARAPRWLVDDAQFHAPFLGTFVNRLGAVRACQENAERLLRREELLAVFPEGFNAADRRYEDRHRLMRFGRGGYVKLALRTNTPVIPVAIVHCDHEQSLWRKRIGGASRLLGGPLVALGPGWSRVGLMSVPPLTGQIRITIGAPVREISRQDAHATGDDGLIHELNECVRGALQELVNVTLKS